MSLEAVRLLWKSPAFRRATRDVAPDVVWAIVVLMASTAAGLVAIDFQARFLGHLKPEGGTPGQFVGQTLWSVFVAFVIAQVSFEVLQFFRRLYQNRIGTKVAQGLKERVFQRMLELDYATLQAENQGNMVQLFSADATQLGAVWAEGILSFATTLLLASGVSFFLWLKLGWPGFVFLGMLIVLVILAQKFARESGPVLRARSEHSSLRLAEIQEAVRAMATVKMLGAEQTFLKRIFHFSMSEQQDRLQATTIGSRYIPLFASLRWLGWALVLAWLIFFASRPDRMAESGLTGEDIVALVFAVNWYSTLLQESFLMVGLYLNFIQIGSVAAGRIDSFLAGPGHPLQHLGEKSTQASFFSTDPQVLVACQCAEFAYPSRPEVKALKQFSYEFKQGSFVAVVGRLGSGKTTLARALLGDLNPNAGTVWRKPGLKVSLVTQEPFLHSATLRDTVRFEFVNATGQDADLAALLDDAQFAQDLGALTEGLDTFVGERGVTLSGGQKQRVSLARAAYFEDADLILLDDPLSGLDRLTAQKITETLLHGRWKHKTKVVITHRLESVQTADHILVLDEGRLVSQGTHATLLVGCPVYQELWSRSLQA